MLLARVQSNGHVYFLGKECTEILFLGRYIDIPNKIVKKKKGQRDKCDALTAAASWHHQTVVVWGTLSVGNVCTHCSSLWIYWKTLHCSVMENTKRKHILRLYRQLYKHSENVLCQGLLILFFIHLQVSFESPKSRIRGWGSKVHKQCCALGCVCMCVQIYMHLCVCPWRC